MSGERDSCVSVQVIQHLLLLLLLYHQSNFFRLHTAFEIKQLTLKQFLLKKSSHLEVSLLLLADDRGFNLARVLVNSLRLGGRFHFTNDFYLIPKHLIILSKFFCNWHYILLLEH